MLSLSLPVLASAGRRETDLLTPKRKSGVAPLGEVDVLELEVFLVELGLGAHPGELPRCDVGEVLVVAERLAVLGLVLDAEVPTAALLAVQRVDAQQLGELHEVGDAARLLERLVERLVAAEHLDVGVELV